MTVNAGADDRALQVAADFAGAALATIRPACDTTLPSVVVTLRGIIQSTEAVAQHVLDAADRSSAAVARLRDGVAVLSSAASGDVPETREACDDVSQSLEVLATAIARIGDDMQFQDLTAQYLRAAIDTIEGLQEQLSQVLMILPSGAADEQTAPGRLAAKLGSPAMVAPWRQELADLLTKERNADGAAKASQA
jgi:chemotaxis regulatin CheY-phosphate phosphatase CheZ